MSYQQPYFPPPPMPQAPPKRSVVPIVIACVAGVLAVLGIAGTATGFVLYEGQKSNAATDPDAKTVRQAACDFMTAFGTYDYTNFDKSNDAVLGASTGSFRKTYTDTVVTLKDSIVSQQLTSKVVENHCGVMSVGDHKAQVLVATKQTVSKPADPNPAPRTTMVTVSLEQQPDGRWLVNDVSVLS